MTERYHGLDMLRAVAMLLGVVIHAPLPFLEPAVLRSLDPGLTAPEVGLYWNVIALWIHQWRMPVFFILAGFFAAMVLARKGTGHFLRDRSLRVLGPLLLFLTLFTPLAEKSWAALHHLWFLWFLVQFSALAALGHALGLGTRLRPLTWVLATPARLVVLLLPMLLLVRFAKSELLGHAIPETLWEFEPRGLLYYGFFFVIGLGLWPKRGLFDALSRHRLWGPLVAIGTLGSLVTISLLLSDREPGIAGLFAVAAGQLSLSFGFIGLALGVVRQNGPVLRFLVESAYAVYLFHLYLVLGLGAEMIRAGLPADLGIPLAALSALGLSLILYVVLVRYTPLDWVLSGYRNARMKWPLSYILKQKDRPEGRP